MAQATFSPATSPFVHEELLAAAVLYDSAVPIHHPDDLIRDPALLATLPRMLGKHQIARPNLDMPKHEPPPLCVEASGQPKAPRAL
jgi:hypothetical protein